MFSSLFSRLFIVTMVIATFCFHNTASGNSLEKQILKLQKKYQSTTSISFDFLQQTSTSGRLREAVGNAVFIRTQEKKEKETSANRTIIRWNYTYPSQQIILNNGKELSLYTAEDKQLIITSSDQLESDITYGLFSGTIKILDVFYPELAENTANTEQQTTALLLTPKEPHAQLQVLQIWYSSDFTIEKLLMRDHFGSVTTLSFSNISLDTISPDDDSVITSILTLDVPEETEIIRQQ